MSYNQYEYDWKKEQAQRAYAAKSKVVDLGYTPRPFQAHLHNSLRRFNVLVCHRRFGKTVFAIMETIDRALRCELKNPQCAYIAPTYGQAKRVAWEYMKDFTKHIPGAKAHEQELRIDIPRPDRGDKIRFMLLGADNPDSLAGIYLDGAVLDEYSLMNPVVWSTLIRPALSDRLGWAIFIGTPRGQNHFYDLYTAAEKESMENWFAAIYKASETGVVAQDELDDAKMTMSEEEYEQEYECSWTAALRGSYYGKYIVELEEKGRVTDVPYDPAVLVDTYWDLGIGDSTTIWFIQQVGKEVHVIDYLEHSGVGLEWYARELKNKPYAYGDHYIPHDGAAKELGTGVSRQETLLKYGIRSRIVKRQSVDDGINAVRVVLPYCWFDKEKTSDGLNALKNYQRLWDNKKAMFLDKPHHDWSSHAADAFRMFGLSYRPSKTAYRDKPLPRMSVSDYSIL